jgi:hypothetical protein
MMIVRRRIRLGSFSLEFYCLESGLLMRRQIDHLILCVHGIGQKLGERMEGVNFVHGTLATLPLF